MRNATTYILLSFLVVFLSLPFLFYRVASQELPESETSRKEPEASPPPQKVDRDKNKLFDDLEILLLGASDEDEFPVIVRVKGSLDLIPNLKSRHGDFTESFTYPSFNGFAAHLTKRQIIAFSQDPVVRFVEFDAPVYPHLDSAQNWFGTAKARTDFGIDGNTDGVPGYSKDDAVIAILDTGIDPGHVDLDGGKIIGWKDVNNNQPDPYDETGPCGGHGTHVSSMVAGEGDGNPAFKGVAPGAALVGVKVLSERLVQGTIRCTASTSEIVAGVQWVIDNKTTYGIEVGNMSLGAAGCSDGQDSLSAIVNTAVDAGIVMTVSAGNEGPGPCTIGSPAAAEKAITVGAMADVSPGASSLNQCGDNDLPGAGFYLACFSSRGTTADGRIKPDIVSPGVFINAAKAGTASDYIVYSGTSMASPFTAGVAALVRAVSPGLSPAQVKSTIEITALDWGPSGRDVDYGSGRLQGFEAVKSAGGFSGNGPSVPSHSFIQDSLSSSNTEDIWDISVTDTSFPLVITMVMPNWSRFNDPDFDMELRDPNSVVIATSLSAIRQETIGVQPPVAGVYQLRVYRYRGSGPYFFDVSFGQAAVAITLLTDGDTPFGILPPDTVRDTTSFGTDDPQRVRVDAGPANINVKTTSFNDGTNSWSLGTTNGQDQVRWEFSKDGAGWNTFNAANTLYPLESNVVVGNTQDVYFRLMTPTSSSSKNQFSATVTMVATSP